MTPYSEMRITCADCDFHSSDRGELVDHSKEEGHLLTEVVDEQ